MCLERDRLSRVPSIHGAVPNLESLSHRSVNFERGCPSTAGRTIRTGICQARWEMWLSSPTCSCEPAPWHWAAEWGCPRSRRVLEGKRTNHGHCKFGADSGLSNASSSVRELPANSCLPPGQNEKHNIVWHRFVPQRSNHSLEEEERAASRCHVLTAMRSECAKDSRAKLGLARALDWSPQDLQDLPRGVAPRPLL